jgi:hypothetical protein
LEKFIYIRNNDKRKDRYFNCEISNCPNSTNRIEFTYNIPPRYQKIKLIPTRAATSTLPISVAAFSLKRQASLTKTSTVIENSVT